MSWRSPGRRRNGALVPAAVHAPWTPISSTPHRRSAPGAESWHSVAGDATPDGIVRRGSFDFDATRLTRRGVRSRTGMAVWA